MVEFVSVEEAKQRSGLRVVMVGIVPSPWGEAAKGILFHKKIPYVAARLGTEGPAVKDWTGHDSAPVAVYENEAPRTGWVEILLLAERLAPTPALIPANPEDRALLFGLSHEICGEDGLGWARRLHGIHVEPHRRCRFPPTDREVPRRQVRLSRRQRRGGRPARRRATRHVRPPPGAAAPAGKPLSDRRGVHRGRHLPRDVHGPVRPAPERSVSDSRPLPHAFSAMDDATRAALDPALIEHRDEIYEKHLELPLTL